MKPYFAIQLCCYAEMLEREQGVRPRNVAIVLGNQEIVTLRVEDYAAYYASLKSAFLTFQENGRPSGNLIPPKVILRSVVKLRKRPPR